MRSRYTLRKQHIKEMELPEFDPNKTYSEFELEAYTDMLLRDDVAANADGPKILFQEHIEPRWTREVHSSTGEVDAAITSSLSKDGQMMYNRTHPEGRKVNTDTQRKRHGASYYR